MNYKDNDMSSPLFQETLDWEYGGPMRKGWYICIGSSEYKLQLRDSPKNLWYHLVGPDIDVWFDEPPECWHLEHPMVRFEDDSEGRLRADICAMPTWEDFDKLIQVLKSEYGAKVVKELDGLDARVWELQVDGIEFMLYHDHHFSNELVATSDESRAFVKKVGIDLGRRLKEQSGKSI